MSWRTVVISKNAKLDYQLGYLVVRNQDVVKIHISEIAVLIIETTCTPLPSVPSCATSKENISPIRNQPNISTRYWHLHPTRRQERSL